MYKMSSTKMYVDPKTIISIPEFNPEILNEKFFRMTILGASYSGKSYFIKYVYPFIYKKYSKIYVFTPSFNADFYEDFIYDKYNKKGKLITKTQLCYCANFDEVIGMCTLIRDNNTDEDTILIILDDIISNKATKNDEFLKLFASCRHSKISLIYNIQFITHEYANNSLRANSNVLVVTRPSSINSRQWIKKNILEEPICKENLNASDEQLRIKIAKTYANIFDQKYDKAVVYEDKLYKASGDKIKI